MKLLKKSEIAAHQAAERRVSIDEGAKLAKQVDRLREVKAEEEKSLALFRQKTVAQINTEIVEATQKRDALRTEARKLQKQIDAGTTEVDERKALVAAQAAHYDSLMRLLVNDRTEVEKALTAAKSELKKAKVATFKAETSEYRAMQTLIDADNKRIQAEALLEQAVEIRDDATTYAEDLQAKLDTRDKVIASKEQEITIKEAALLKTEQELRDKEIKLRDREATLERAFKRIKYGSTRSVPKR